METLQTILKELDTNIKDGKFDEFLTLPFMSRELLHSNLKSKILRKSEKGASPILSDEDIKNTVKDLSEASVSIYAIFKEMGLLEVDENGEMSITKKGKTAIKHSILL